MKVNSFQCDSCAGSIPLSDLSNITVCPYCKKNFYVNEEWEESLRIATKKAEAVLVRNIKDIQIPEVQEKIAIRDIEILKRINESIIFLNRAVSEVSAKLRANNEVIAQIENTVGLKYEELTVKTPDPTVAETLIYPLGAVLIWLTSMFDAFFIGHDASIGQFLLTTFVAAPLWPVFIIVWLADVTLGYRLVAVIMLALIAFITIVVWSYKSYKRHAFLESLDANKRDLDLKRIKSRKQLLKENISLSLEIDLLSITLAELKELSRNVAKKTQQFFNLSPEDIIKKVNFAIQRMKAAPIEFEVACANFSSNEYKDPIEYPLEKHNHDDVKIQIQKAIEHIKM